MVVNGVIGILRIAVSNYAQRIAWTEIIGTAVQSLGRATVSIIDARISQEVSFKNMKDEAYR